MADIDKVNMTDLASETSSTLDGSEQFVMFDSQQAKRATVNEVKKFMLSDSTTEVTDLSKKKVMLTGNESASVDTLATAVIESHTSTIGGKEQTVKSAVDTNTNALGGHSVKSDVPEGAVFTDTTYSTATASTDGLMSASDKTNLDYDHTAITAPTVVTDPTAKQILMPNSEAIDYDKLADAIISKWSSSKLTNNLSASAAGTALDALQGKVLVDEIATTNNTVANLRDVVDREFFRMLPKGGTHIPPNADLNSIEYIKVGNYYNSANAETQTMKNCPAGAFIMYVLSPLSEAYDDESTRAWVYRLRIFVEYTGNIFTQMVWSANTAGIFDYGPWVKMTDSNDLADGLMSASDKTNLDYDHTAITAPTVVTDPTAKQILMPNSEAIDYDKLADAIISKWSSSKLTNNLSASAAGTALDALQGKVLADEIATTNNTVANLLDVVDGTTAREYASGDMFQFNGVAYIAKTTIASGTSITADNIGSYATALSESAINSLAGSVASINETLSDTYSMAKTVSDAYNSNITLLRYYGKSTNLNWNYDNGWVAFDYGCEGAPADYGVCLTLANGKHSYGVNCFLFQLVFGTFGGVWTRYNVNQTVGGVGWSAWKEL